ncbi:MAG: biotin--[acetyl-CoA-carboxylase] ligase [Phycisphaerae bacterium]
MHRLSPQNLSHGLSTQRIGRHILVLPEVDSTNRYALSLADAEGATSDGTVIFAERQTAGRGRFGRTWHSPNGASLLMTALLWEEGARRHGPAFLIMAAGLAVVRGIELSTDVSPVIRWPNDIYVRDRKLAGVLVEVGAKGKAVAIGIGVNCLQQTAHFPIELSQAAISLELASSLPVDRSSVGRAIIKSLDKMLGSIDDVNDTKLAADWSACSDDMGRRATLIREGQPYRGQIVDIHPAEGLVLQLDSGGRRHFDPETTTRE